MYFEKKANDNEVRLLTVAAQPVDGITPEIKETTLGSRSSFKKQKPKSQQPLDGLALCITLIF